MACRSAYLLIAPADDFVHALKYEGWRALADPMGRAVAREAADTVRQAGWVVVPVPTTEVRLRERSYNQAGLLAGVVARALGLPRVNALVRAGAGTSQTALTPDERRENVVGAFTPAPSVRPDLAGASVLLVDDVLTTGATATEATRALVAAGVAEVSVATFARAVPDRRFR